MEHFNSGLILSQDYIAIFCVRFVNVMMVASPSLTLLPFPKKNELPRVGLEPMTLYTLDRALYH